MIKAIRTFIHNRIDNNTTIAFCVICIAFIWIFRDIYLQITDMYNCTATWNNTTDNITSLSFYSGAGSDVAIGVGSFIQVWALR